MAAENGVASSDHESHTTQVQKIDQIATRLLSSPPILEMENLHKASSNGVSFNIPGWYADVALSWPGPLLFFLKMPLSFGLHIPFSSLKLLVSYLCIVGIFRYYICLFSSFMND